MDNTELIDDLRSALELQETKIGELDAGRYADMARITELERELAAAQAREKVLRSLSNELLHQIDINDFTDSHGHSAKMLKAVHDVMKYNTQPTDNTSMNNLLAEGQAREKVLRDALESVRQYGSDTLSGRIDGPDDRAWQRGAVLEMTRRARVTIDAPTDDTALRAALKAERVRCKDACEKIHERGFRTTAWECVEAIRALDDE